MASGVRLTDSEYKARVAVFGRVVPLEEYKNSLTPILHKCLVHGEEHESTPKNCLKGRGLKCCHSASVNTTNTKRVQEASRTYGEKLAKFGRLILVGEYKTSKTPTLHKCLLHGEEHLTTPCSALQGKGLKCCHSSVAKSTALRKNIEARKEYESRLALIGRVELLGEYIDAVTPVLHRCKIHGEEHLAKPNHLLHGVGLSCCHGGGDSYKELYSNKVKADSPCEFYLATVNGQYLKPGIAVSAEQRERQSEGFYGGYEFVSHKLRRCEAWTIEQIILKRSRSAKPKDLPELYDNWRGRTELRYKEMFDVDWYKDEFYDLLTELDELGWEQLYKTHYLGQTK